MIYKSTCTIIDLLQPILTSGQFSDLFFFVYEIIQFWSQPIWQPMIWPLLQLACTRVLWPSVRIDPKNETLFFPLVTITFIKTRIIKDIHMKPWWIFYTQVRNNICMDCNKKHLHGCCTYTVLYKNKMEDCCFLDLLIAFSSPHKQCYFSDVIKYTDFCCSYCLFAFYSLRVVFSNNF